MFLILEKIAEGLAKFFTLGERTAIADLHFESSLDNVGGEKQFSLFKLDAVCQIEVFEILGWIVRDNNVFIESVADRTLHSVLFNPEFVVAKSAGVFVIALAYAHKLQRFDAHATRRRGYHLS